LNGLKDWLHRRRHPQRFALLDQLLRTQAMSREQVLRKQREDLAQIVAFAVDNTDYYGRRFADSRDIASLPILTKDEVRANLDAMLARNADRTQAHIGYTGGSTGQPLAFWWDSAKHELMRAGMMRSYMMSGWRPGQKILNFWGARQDIRSGGLAKRYGEYITGEKTIAAHAYTQAQLGEWAGFVRAWRPILLQGYASIIAELASFVIDHKLRMPTSLLGVFSTAEMLDDRQRQLMEQAFGCKVFNQYGCREIPNIACECRHGNMHVFTDMVYLQSLPGNGEDHLIVTSLTNRLMPFIRYDIGDSGRLKDGECACGSPFPLMEMGMCRQNDLVRTPGDKRIYPSYFNRLLCGLEQIRQYQLVQSSPERLTLNLVTTSPLPAAAIATLHDSIRRDLDANMQFEVNYVERIEPTASGKRRFVVSHCT